MSEAVRRLFVGGLAYDVVGSDLAAAFATCGEVVSAEVVCDQHGRLRGFGWVEMSSPSEARAGVAALDGHELKGRRLVVRLAEDPPVPEPEPERAPSGESLEDLCQPGTSLLLRVDASSPAAWADLQARLTDPGAEFAANLSFTSDARFEGLGLEDLTEHFLRGTGWTFLLVADAETFAAADFPVLVLDLDEEPGRYFRAAADALWSVENNLSLGNLDFREFAEATDAEGVFRGFPV